MIEVQSVDKYFGDVHALDNVTMNIGEGSIYGLVGTNGSGKTTILKHITGVLKPDAGEITLDEMSVFENNFAKRKMAFIPDDLYFYGNYNLNDMSKLYKRIYEDWEQERFDYLIEKFELDRKRKIIRFSKGMQKQAMFSLAISTMPKYLILDEPVDGLDPLVRRIVWDFIVNDVAERKMTALISSHNLKEIEGICDTIGILSKGKVVLERDLDTLKSGIHKVQVAFPENTAKSGKIANENKSEASENQNGNKKIEKSKKAREEKKNRYMDLNVLRKESVGSVDMLIVNNSAEEIEKALSKYKPTILDMLPLTLEEIFIYELGGENNEFKGILS